MAQDKIHQSTANAAKGSLAYWLAEQANDVAAGLNELITDHATFKAVVDDLKTLANAIRAKLLYMPLGNPGFQIRSNFDVQNANAISYTNAGTIKTFAATSEFDTGTAQVIAADKWSSALLSISGAGAGVVTWSATLNANDEAAAKAALPAVPAGNTSCGYITVKTASGQSWTAGTDALKTGTGGNVASETNYYNEIDTVGSMAAITSASPATLTATAVDTVYLYEAGAAP